MKGRNQMLHELEVARNQVRCSSRLRSIWNVHRRVSYPMRQRCGDVTYPKGERTARVIQESLLLGII